MSDVLLQGHADPRHRGAVLPRAGDQQMCHGGYTEKAKPLYVGNQARSF
jgi:hypothetical protein